MIGIYKIVNIKNSKIYIGSSINVENRLKEHKKSLLEGKHHSIKLQRSYDIHGENNFKYEIIEECSKESLLSREQYYIDLYDCYNKGYNSVPKAGSNIGMKHSDETIEKIRRASMGNKNRLNMTFTIDVKNRISLKLKGRKLSEETKKKMSESRKGKMMPEETKLKLSLSHTGKVLSMEHKKKLSLSHIGKEQSRETIDKRVKKNTGKKRTIESRNKISEKLKGIVRGPLSDERKLELIEKISKKVAFINDNGDIVKEYNSIKNCASDLNIDYRRISDVIHGVKKEYKGFKFKLI